MKGSYLKQWLSQRDGGYYVSHVPTSENDSGKVEKEGRNGSFDRE